MERSSNKKESAYRSSEEKKIVFRHRKCFVCEEERHIARDCPHRKKGEHTDKKTNPSAKTFDPKGKKPNPSIGLMLDVVGEEDKGEDNELMRARLELRLLCFSLIRDPKKFSLVSNLLVG